MRVSSKEDLGRIVAVRANDGQWRVQPPWSGSSAQAAATAATAAPATPYFRQSGWTRVSEAWHLQPQQLRPQARRQLRAALYNSLVGAAVALREGAPKRREQVATQLQQLHLAYKSTAHHLLEDLLTAHSEGAVASFVESRRIADLQLLEQALLEAGLEWQSSNPQQESRVPVALAQQHIAKLQDVQVVLESILGAEWEHWGPTRGSLELEPLPTHRVPAHSLNGGIGLLESCTTASGAASHLTTSPDQAWIFVSPPAG
jgi:hypothetical protein